jgi:hypothetical protein
MIIRNKYGDFTGIDAKVDAVYGQYREPNGQNVVLELLVSVRNWVSERAMYTAGDPHVVMIEAKFRVNPKRMNTVEVRATPAAMYGLLRPKRDLQLSAMTPVSYSVNGRDEKRRVGQTDEGLHDETGKGSGDEDQGHERFREAEGDEVWRSYMTCCVIQRPGWMSFRCDCSP